MKVYPSHEIFYVCCWIDKEANAIHPNALTVAHTTRECSEKTQKILGMTRHTRAAHGFKILPFRVHFEPAWIEVTDRDNVVPLRKL